MRKRMKAVLIVLLGTAVLFGAALCAGWYYHANYVLLDGTLYKRDVETLDLSGALVSDPEKIVRFSGLKRLDVRAAGITPEQYAWLCRELPECEITWELPFQGAYYSLDTQTLTLTSLTEDEVLLLDYLPALSYIDAAGCQDYPQLLELQQRRPECTVFYTVVIAGKEWDCDTAALELADADPEELGRTLPLLGEVRHVALTGALPEPEAMDMLRQLFPEISWQLEIEGVMLEDSITALDLSGVPLENAEKAERILAYLPELKEVDMCGCGLSNEDMMALVQRHPQISFVWEITIASVTVRTDVEEIDLSGQEVADPAVIEDVLPCFPNLKQVVMCGCGISNEEMDALNRRHEDIRFVWSVYIGPILMRTDATWFMPVQQSVIVDDAALYNLRYCTELICIDIGHMPVYNCEWVAYMPNMKYLLLADTEISDLTPLTGLENLIYLEIFLTPVQDYSPLVTCTALQDLNMCYTYGNPEPISRMPWLKNLWWSGSWNASSTLLDKLPDTHMDFTTVSSTGGGWRQLQNYYDMRDLLGVHYMYG